jgi:hypothetical protein
MHALTILHRCLGSLLTGIHSRRLAVLLEAVAATVSGPRLTLTDIGRRFGGEASLRNKIKRSDRLLGNRHLQGQARMIYTALARMLLSGVVEPLIVIDWSDLKRDQSLYLLRASLPVGGRSLTLYEEVHPQEKLGNRQVQHRFLQRLDPRFSSRPVTWSSIRASSSARGSSRSSRVGVPIYTHKERGLDCGERWHPTERY